MLDWTRGPGTVASQVGWAKEFGSRTSYMVLENVHGTVDLPVEWERELGTVGLQVSIQKNIF